MTFYLTSYAPLQDATETQVALSAQHAAAVEEEVLILSSFCDIHLLVGSQMSRWIPLSCLSVNFEAAVRRC